MKTKGKVTKLDKIAGKNLKRLREVLGMNQTTLGAFLKISFQQVQKYENGTNRIPAASLYKLSQKCGVRMEAFFEEVK